MQLDMPIILHVYANKIIIYKSIRVEKVIKGD